MPLEIREQDVLIGAGFCRQCGREMQGYVSGCTLRGSDRYILGTVSSLKEAGVESTYQVLPLSALTAWECRWA